MTKITIQPSCENAPRKSFLKDFNVAFATGNAGFIIDQVHEDITWVIHGDKMIRGKDQFAQEVNLMKEYIADELVIHNIITHGREAALNGEMKMGGETYVFCDVYRLLDTRNNVIKEMNSYVIKIK